MSTRKITVDMLREADACEDQVDIFAKTFPTGATVTLTNCRKAVAAGLDLTWAADEWLSAPARKAYEEATATAWKAYGEAKAPALKAYLEAKAPAFYRAWRAM